ncbi:MAG: alginate export family protein [Pseudomonadota bacterium]
MFKTYVLAEKQAYCTLAVLLMIVLCSPKAMANSAIGLDSEHGKLWLDGRLRAEQVDEENALQTAEALILRTRLGYSTPEKYDWKMLIEAENSYALQDDYNSTTNGRTDHSVIADPEDTEINRALLSYRGFRDTTLTLGRQRIVFDNARFIGNVGWRNNEQTFDAGLVEYKPVERLSMKLGYIGKVRRIFGPDSSKGTFDMSSPIVNLSYQNREKSWKLSSYGYFLDFQDNPANSQKTLGLSLSGKLNVSSIKPAYHLEYARQSAYKGSSISSALSYLHTKLTADINRVKLTLGYENLGSSNNRAFQTPLATGHAFNGWSDRFLATPVNGLQDQYVGLGSTMLGVKVLARHHRFRSDAGSQDYGSELNVLVKKAFNNGINVGLKLARYSAKTHSVDADKFWLFGEYTFGQ